MWKNIFTDTEHIAKNKLNEILMSKTSYFMF